jgi:type II secretory pathway component GspD/PulD (secretin)
MSDHAAVPPFPSRPLTAHGNSGRLWPARRRGRCRGVLIAAVIALASAGAAAGEPRLPPGPYRYVVLDQDLRDVLAEFGRNLNLIVRLSDDVQGRVRGPVAIATAEEFLARLCETFGLVWFFDGTVLYVNAATELRTELMELGSARADEVSRRLKELGTGDQRFHLNVAAESGVISVFGPPPYLARVKEMLTLMARTRSTRSAEIGDDNRVRVFRGGL